MARIWIDAEFDELMSSLSPSGKEQTFENFAHTAAFCAGLAFNKKGTLRKEFVVKGGAPNREIRDNVLDGQDLKEQIDILALAHTGSHEILKDDEETKDERYRIFQNYANTGLKLLAEIKEKKATDTSGVDTVIQILSEISSKNVSNIKHSEIGDTEF
jgi:dnd system-associated protein 4